MMLASPDEELNSIETKVEPKLNGYTEVPTHIDAQQIISSTRQSLSDLPVLPKEMNTLSVILIYSILGISVDEISMATKITAESIIKIKKLPSFTSTLNEVVDQVLEFNKDNVREYLSSHAKSAAEVQVDFLTNGDDKIKQKAAMDIMDRSGHRPADIVEHRHSMSSGLTITYIDERDQIDKLIEIIEE